MPQADLPRRLAAEFLGTAFLLAAVVGSGIMGDELSGGNTAIALLANSIATGAALVVLITVFGPISGAHLNPVVMLAAARLRELSWQKVPSYVLAQIAGGYAGLLATHAMFDKPWISLSSHQRSGGAQLFSEVLATFGLVLVIWGSVRVRPSAIAWVVGLCITAAYWFTSSTLFANPAVTLARLATDTFTGIRPVDAPGFVAAELGGGLLATWLVGWLYSGVEST